MLLVLSRAVSFRVKKRFPDLQHLVDTKAAAVRPQKRASDNIWIKFEVSERNKKITRYSNIGKLFMKTSET